LLDTASGVLQDVDLEEPLTETMAEVYVGRTAFKTGPPRLVGVELEWLVHDAARPDQPVPVERLRAALADLDPARAAPLSAAVPSRLGSPLTTEPGGQLELSSPPAPLVDCLRATAADMAVLRDRLARAGLVLVGLGVDPVRPPVRQNREPRYVAMERHFDRLGPAGRVMMCSTASVQVCLDAGADDADVADRWQALHELVPVLVALFANSPLREGRPTGWRCSRQEVWSRIDPSRTRPPADVDPRRTRAAPGDPRSAYAEYALAAAVLAVRREHRPWDAPAGLTFRDWIRGAGPPSLGRPTVADLDYHLSTLFPPVRPRGHLELRVLDAQAGDRWRVAAAVVAGVLDDATARSAAVCAAEPVRGSSASAARLGLADPELARAGIAVLEAAVGALRRAGLRHLADDVEEYAERYPARLRSPADDVLDDLAAGRPPGHPDARAATSGRAGPPPGRVGPAGPPAGPAPDGGLPGRGDAAADHTPRPTAATTDGSAR